jgi:hypothetical protein
MSFKLIYAVDRVQSGNQAKSPALASIETKINKSLNNTGAAAGQM